VSHESGNPLETEGGLQLTPREEPWSSQFHSYKEWALPTTYMS
jgi:hypothetical protein